MVSVGIGALLVILSGCAGPGAGGARDDGTSPEVPARHQVALWEVPRGELHIRQGESIVARAEELPSGSFDSLTASFGPISPIHLQGLDLRLATDSLPVGTHILTLTTWKDGRGASTGRQVVLTAAQAPQRYSYRVIARYPHKTDAYTQGLLFHDGALYESTGQRGESSLRRVAVQSGEVEQYLSLDPRYFGEGLALHDGLLYQLTWTSRVAFVYSLSDFSLQGKRSYSTEGWGLVSDGRYLYMSDGSERIQVLDPASFATVRTLQVYDHRGPQRMLNELEFIDGLLYANVYMSDRIVAIDPLTGAVLRDIDLAGLLPLRDRTARTDVLNGIAYDSISGAIYVTGKYWPWLYQVSFVAP